MIVLASNSKSLGANISSKAGDVFVSILENRDWNTARTSADVE